MLCACSNNENYFDENETNGPVTPGTYYANLLLATESSEEADVITRGGPDNNGQFTNVYPYDYIYIHKADNLSLVQGHQSIKIPLEDVELCDDCKGIRLKVEVADDAAGGGYTITNPTTNESIKLAADDDVYFSTIADTYWEAKKVGASPITGSDVFVQDNDINKELLRSEKTYTKGDLIALLQEGTPSIGMERHCTAFRVYFMFTKVASDGSDNNTIERNDWISALGEAYAPENFYIKLYLGPNFARQYNVFQDLIPNADDKGFYATNNQKYQPFEQSRTGDIGADGDFYMYTGYGYETAPSNHLISPLNPNLPADDFSVYAFIKYTPTPETSQNDENFLTSDEGSKWFQVQVPAMTLETNRSHWIVLAFDINTLKVFQNNTAPTLTRSFGGPEKMEVKPLKIIHKEKPF